MNDQLGFAAVRITNGGQPGRATLIPCPSCGRQVSDRAPSCPNCGHPVNPTKSAATMVLVFGIISLLPGYGLIFGPLAWGFGVRELRGIATGHRLRRGRRKARIGRALGIVGTAMSVLLVVWVVATTDRDTLAAVADGRPVFLAEHDITFEYPDSWERARGAEPASYPAGSLAVTPDSASYANGSWMLVMRVPRDSATAAGATEATFAAQLANEVAGKDATITLGPKPIEVAGISGLEAHVEGLRGARTGNPLSFRTVILFGEEASYWFSVQFHADEQDVMLSAWDRMLDLLQVRDVSAVDGDPEFDQLLIADFENGPDPFVTGQGRSGTLSVRDGVYRADVVPGPGVHSSAGFLSATQATTIVADGIRIEGMLGHDWLGIGCVNQRYGYSARVSGSGLFELYVTSDNDEQLLFSDQFDALLAAEGLRQLAITCVVDSAGSGSILVAVNGQPSVRITHEDPRLNYLTAVELVFQARDDNPWSVEIDLVTADVPATSSIEERI